MAHKSKSSFTGLVLLGIGCFLLWLCFTDVPSFSLFKTEQTATRWVKGGQPTIVTHVPLGSLPGSIIIYDVGPGGTVPEEFRLLPGQPL